jgi:hypothetical protein
MRGVVLATLLLAAPAANAAGAAAEQGAVGGRVIEAVSGRALAGASVTAAGLTARSGADGAYRLLLPPGAWTLEVRADGHLPDSQRVTVGAAATLTVDLYVIERRRFQEEVVVTAEMTAESEAPAELPVRPTDVTLVAGGADNVFRTLQTLPGVAATDEFGSRLAVRGGGPDQNLTVMDGVEIHNPYRLFGLTSAFSPETVRSFELSTGAFSARYGDRLSSLLVIENRDGNAARGFSGAAALSITDLSFVGEGRLPGTTQGSSFLVTGRRTYYDLVAERFVDSQLPAFRDLQGRATWELAPGRRLTLFGLTSREATDAFFEGDRPGEGGDFVTGVDNDVVSLSFDSLLGNRGRTRTVASYYRNVEGIDVDAQFRAEARRSNAEADDTAFSLADVAFTRDLSVRDLSLRQELTYEASGRQRLEAGFEVHRLRTGVRWLITGDRNQQEANGSSLRGGAGLPDDLDSAADGTRFGAWLLDRYQMMRRVVVEPGLRLDYSGANRQATLSPRLSATIALGNATRVRAGVGLFTQSPGYEKLIQADYFVDLSDARGLELPYERSSHAVLSLERDLAPGFTVRAEGYYKTFADLVVGRLETEAERAARVARYDFPAELQWSVPEAPQITSLPSSDARGYAYGFDVYLARRAASASTRLTGWASYTFGVAKRDAYGRETAFDYDRRHAVSAVASFRAGAKWDFAATARVATGFPRTPVLGLRVSAVTDTRGLLVPERDQSGLLVYTTDLGDVANLNTARLPTFARLDLRVNFRPRGASGRWLFYLDLINVLNRENAGGYQASLAYDPASDRPRLEEKPARGIPFLPSFGVRVRF